MFIQQSDQIIRTEWFRDMRIHSGFQTVFYIFVISVGAHGNNGQTLIIYSIQCPDFRCSLIAIHNRHLDVHQYRVIMPLWVPADLLQADLPIFSPFDFNSVFGEDQGCNFRVYFVILYQ